MTQDSASPKNVALSSLTLEKQQDALLLHPAIWAASSGVLVDGASFSFKNHRYQYPLYCDKSQDIVVMKSAQMGATIWMALRAMHQAIYPEAWGYTRPIKVGFYFPDATGVNMLVKGRIEPMLRSTPFLSPYAREQSRAWKPFGKSALYFFYMEGRSSKDSTPLMSTFFDEVRLMNPSSIGQALERLGHSERPHRVLASTAGLPESDIHRLFLDSDQKYFTTICERCGCEQILCLEFPECIVEHLRGTMAGQTYYQCKKCKQRINDPQHGRYIAHGDPKHHRSGYQFSQMLSHAPTATPASLLSSYREALNKKEWVNAKLGIPFIDTNNQPLSPEMLERNISPLIQWGKPIGTCFMGIDQMVGFNVVCIVARRGEGRQVVWYEIIESLNPWNRTAQLMEDFDVEVCFLDSEPNANEALRFARDFDRRVFLVKRGSYADLIRWQAPRKVREGHRKAEKESFYEMRVFLDKYKDIERTIEWLKELRVRWGVPEELTQIATPLRGGRPTEQAVWRTHAIPQISSPIRVEESDGEGGTSWKWHFVGGDPHSLDALCYALRASEKKLIQSSFSGSL